MAFFGTGALCLAAATYEAFSLNRTYPAIASSDVYRITIPLLMHDIKCVGAILAILGAFDYFFGRFTKAAFLAANALQLHQHSRQLYSRRA